MISVQYSVFSAQNSVFSVQCSVFSVQCSVFSVQCSVFCVQCSVSHVSCSIVIVHCSVLSAQCSVLNALLSEFIALCTPIQYTVVQSIELQGNRGAPKSRQNSSGTGISKFARAVTLATVYLTAITAKVVHRRRQHFSLEHPFCRGIFSINKHL